MKNKTTTITYIKSHALKNLDEILAIIRKNGFEIILISEEMTLKREQAETFYAEHKDKSFFENLVKFTCEGPVVAAVLEKEDAIENFRTLIGATDPAKAEKGTIRQLYGDAEAYAQGKPWNAIHGSDSPSRVIIETEFLFPGFVYEE